MITTAIDKTEELFSTSIPPRTQEEKCETCACSSCYGEGFCDHCSTCTEASRFRERCNAYEGPFTY